MKFTLKTALFQAVLLPVFSILAYIIIIFITAKLNLSDIVATLILLAVMAAAGFACGFIFSKKVKNKPSSALKRYLFMCLMPVYALVLWLLCYHFSGGDPNSGIWGLFALKNPAFLVMDIILAFGGYLYTTLLLEITIYVSFIVGFAVSEAAGRRAAKGRKNLITQWAMVAAVLVIFAWSFNYVYNFEYQPKIIDLTMGTVDINDNLDNGLVYYEPFQKDNELATLSGPASLQFGSFAQMPRLDGATAAYPVYAAYVQAVYGGLKNYTKDADSEGQDFIDNTAYPYSIVQCSQTAKAYDNLLARKADIIFTAEPSKAEVQHAAKLGVKFDLTPIGKDAFVFFVNTENNASGLTSQQIRGIYSGSVKNWAQVGGSFHSILAYQRPEDSGSQTVMQNVVMKGAKLMTPKKEDVVEEMFGTIEQVAAYHNSVDALGYTFMYYSSAMVKSDKIKYLAVDGVKPTPETVRDGSYPYTETLYAVTLSSDNKAGVKQFLAWMQGSQGQQLVEKTGYVPIKEP